MIIDHLRELRKELKRANLDRNVAEGRLRQEAAQARLDEYCRYVASPDFEHHLRESGIPLEQILNKDLERRRNLRYEAKNAPRPRPPVRQSLRAVLNRATENLIIAVGRDSTTNLSAGDGGVACDPGSRNSLNGGMHPGLGS